MALNTASLKNSLNNYLGSVVNRTDASTETVTRHAELVRKVADVIDGVGTKEDGIKTSKVLSDVGKSQAFAELSTASASKLGFMERVVSSMAEDIGATKASIYTVKTPPNMDKADAREIRDDYKGLSPQEKDVAFMKAAEQSSVKDPEDPEAQVRADALLWAFLTKPGLPMVTTENRDRALKDRASRLNPETVARLHQVEIQHESLSGLRDAVVGWLQGLGGNPAVIFKELGGNEPANSSIDVARKQVQHA